MKIETEKEYKSVVKLADFLADMIQGEEWPESFVILCKLIEEWEESNVKIGETQNGSNLQENNKTA